MQENAKLKQKKNSKSEDAPSPWFDKECCRAKTKIRQLGNQLKKEPYNIEIRRALTSCKRGFKKTVAYKKRRYKRNITDEMTTQST